MIEEKHIYQMRPCVAYALEHGAQGAAYFRKMRHAIIFELNEMGFPKESIRSELLDWNNRNNPRLSPGDAQRQLCDYVDWFFKKDTKLGCAALADYCRYRQGGCAFQYAKPQAEIKIPFCMEEAEKHLKKKCPSSWFFKIRLLKMLFRFQQEKKAEKILFLGLRTIRNSFLEGRERHDPKDISRQLYELENLGFLRIIKGKSGTFGTRKANGYTFLPWVPP